MGRPIKNLTGKRFGRLVVLERIENNKFGHVQWLCRCDCSAEVIVTSNNLMRKHTKSCGCLNIEKIKERKTKHGLYGTKLYKIWQSMKKRCLNKKHKSYQNYGGRGITICNEWLYNFQNFYNWAINNGYQEGLTIERIDNNKNYTSENCCWTSRKQQANNRRSNHLITYNNETHNMKEWSILLGVSYKAFYRRIKKGWDIDRIFNQPYRKGNNGKRKII